AVDLPPSADPAVFQVGIIPEIPPRDLLPRDHLTQLLDLSVVIDSHESKRLILEFFHERPLVWVHVPARVSPVSPEVEKHHLAAVIREPECRAVLVLSLDVGGNRAKIEMLESEYGRVYPCRFCILVAKLGLERLGTGDRLLSLEIAECVLSRA